MPTIRDLVGAIRERNGVEAAIVLGRDGLLIDSQVSASLDAEQVAAHIPPIIIAADEFGVTALSSGLTTAVLEYPRGFAILSVLSPDVILLVLVQPSANIGQLLYELRRNRENIASLV
jgi:predicted regulator of Ras-like GTPase activity (Roadblock/LC7/MglB family)